MSVGFLILTVLFIIVSAVMILIILVQRPQGGGLAGAFGGAGGGSTDTVFGGRVGDALTAMTVFAFATYVLLAVGLNIMDPSPKEQPVVAPAAATQPADGTAQPTTAPEGAQPINVDGSTPPATDSATSPPTSDPVIPPVDAADQQGQRQPDAPPATAPVGGI